MNNTYIDLVQQTFNFPQENIEVKKGDLIFTGTPAGVGEIVVGDEIEAFMEDQSMLTLDVK